MVWTSKEETDRSIFVIVSQYIPSNLCLQFAEDLLSYIIRCESFSTYPRTYDLLHAWMILSETEDRGCSIEDLLIEMDRMLRPEGVVIIRDNPHIINSVRKLLTALKWDGWSSEVEPRTDALSLNEEKVLITRKKLWKEKFTI